MITLRRLLSTFVLLVLGTGLGIHAYYDGPSLQPVSPSPALLAVAHAQPAELAVSDTLRRGETLTQLLTRAELAEADARALVAELREHQDPRRLRPGAVLSFRRSAVSGMLRGLEMKLDADRTLTARREGESWSIAVEEVPVQIDTVVLTGVVESTLYAAMARAEGADVPGPEREKVVDQLAERIFAWQVDFSRDLRKGDEVRVLYERLVRPDGTARETRVLAAQMNINGRDHEAYLFRAPEGADEYYARDGSSLRRAFLRAPLEFRRISSAFSRSRFHPVLGVSRPHNGVDYAAAAGTPVRAVADGVIGRAGWGGGYGNVVDIRHSRGYMTRYAHLRGFASGIRAGTRVRQGDVIGYVGATGLATGPHLHYEFHSNGRAVDPNSIRHLSSDPLPQRHRDAFDELVGLQLSYLDRWMDSLRLADVVEPVQLAGAEE
jgi:murein DD-endopeptidase MepM/ murein hydrolase activator NlpD